MGAGMPQATSSTAMRQAAARASAPAAQHRSVQEAKVHAFWDKSSFRFERADSAQDKYCWNFQADMTAEAPCTVDVHFHCREALNGNRLAWTPVEQGGPPSIARSFGAGKHQVMFDKLLNLKKYPLEVYFKLKKETGLIPIVLSLVANDVQLVTHLTAVPQGNSLQCTMVRQKAVINGAEYPLEEVYGISSVSKEHDNAATGEPCVICLTDPRNTVVLPCQHLCLCKDCASQLQVGAALRGDKCPICRGEISGIRVFELAESS